MSSNGNNNGKPEPIRVLGREPQGKPLPRRFYTAVTVGRAATGPGHAILLDGRAARTPGKRALILPTLRLAEAVAGEWSSQVTLIDPARMPLTRLVNTAIDGVSVRLTEVAADVVRYAGSDLMCYRAEYPDGLVGRQAQLWDPILAWVCAAHGAQLRITRGIVHVDQPPEVAERLAAAVAPLDALRLTALHVMTTLMGSALLGLAVLARSLTPEAAWEAAHVDEDWQISEWGADAEATARRARRWQEMQAAAAMLALVGDA